MGHIIACLWNGISLLEIHYGETRSWLQVKNLENVHWFTNYLEAFYSSVSVI